MGALIRPGDTRGFFDTGTDKDADDDEPLLECSSSDDKGSGGRVGALDEPREDSGGRIGGAVEAEDGGGRCLGGRPGGRFSEDDDAAAAAEDADDAAEMGFDFDGKGDTTISGSTGISGGGGVDERSRLRPFFSSLCFGRGEDCGDDSADSDDSGTLVAAEMKEDK